MKKTITEITEKFDTNGKIVERITKTTIEESCSTLTYPYVTYGETGISTTTTATYDSAHTAINCSR